ncbi:hypothetical protein [Psychromonas ossibalaenae]|uniref:hypothetical protein n=1 Tax=Psychromonas ossibalaenae TaxID=444922 RepID=UPI0003810C54|nr:hypothetical protein [Psychromonas ossibalaenae]
MSSTSINSVITELFNAPLQAAVKADAEYLKIWAQWLTFKKSLMFNKDNGMPIEGIDIDEVLKTAPIVELNGNIDLAITMRIAEVKETNGSLSGGLSVGPIYASGTYGISKQSTHESLFQAASTFVLSNQKKDLADYLNKHSLTIATASDVDNVVTKLTEAANQLPTK